jgi:hypothetical protein
MREGIERSTLKTGGCVQVETPSGTRSWLSRKHARARQLHRRRKRTKTGAAIWGIEIQARRHNRTQGCKRTGRGRWVFQTKNARGGARESAAPTAAIDGSNRVVVEEWNGVNEVEVESISHPWILG